ncbi:MAG TPA: hypothetical protein VFQ95_08015, partial [Rhodanobacteraceae bacterium]|nr:hypothetical protein [Rhodanobacteraceae bacterium]
REHQTRSPQVTQTLAIQRIGSWTYVLQRHVHAGYPPSIRVGRTRREPEHFHLFTLDDEYLVFPCIHDRETTARKLYARVVGSADPAATWATVYASEGV